MKKKLLGLSVALTLAGGVAAVGASSVKPVNPVKAEEPATKTIYLDAGGSSYWDQAGAKFCAWSWAEGVSGSWAGDGFLPETSSGSGVYTAEVPVTSDQVIFVRLKNTATTPNWDDEWNRSGKLYIPDDDDNCYKITGWGSTIEGHSVSDGEWCEYPEPTYYVSINGGADISMIKNTEKETEYKLASHVNLTAGDVLTFKKNSSDYETGVKKNVGESYNNAALTDEGIIVLQSRDDVNIYLDKYEGLWVGGYQIAERTYSVSINGGAKVAMVANPDNADEVKLADNVSVTTGQSVKFYRDVVAYNAYVKDNVGLHINNVTWDGDNMVIVDSAASANFYLNVKTEEVWATGYSSVVTLYFGVAGWDNVYAYVHDDAKPLGEWPGTKIEPTSGVCFEIHGGSEKYGLYKVTVPVGTEDAHVIFNNGLNKSEAGAHETADLLIVDKAFYGAHYETTGDTVRGEAAAFVWDLNEARVGKSHAGLDDSFCGFSEAEAAQFVARYNELTDDVKAYVNAATVWTYTDTVSTEADKDFTFLEVISMLELRSANSGSAQKFYSPLSNNATFTVAVIAASVLAVMAVGFFLLKKKRA